MVSTLVLTVVLVAVLGSAMARIRNDYLQASE